MLRADGYQTTRYGAVYMNVMAMKNLAGPNTYYGGDYHCNFTEGFPTYVCWDPDAQKVWLELSEGTAENTPPEELAHHQKLCEDWGVRPCASSEDYEQILSELGVLQMDKVVLYCPLEACCFPGMTEDEFYNLLDEFTVKSELDEFFEGHAIKDSAFLCEAANALCHPNISPSEHFPGLPAPRNVSFAGINGQAWVAVEHEAADGTDIELLRDYTTQELDYYASNAWTIQQGSDLYWLCPQAWSEQLESMVMTKDEALNFSEHMEIEGQNFGGMTMQ